MYQYKRTKGFTLIELLGVIVILALVIAIAIPVVSNLVTRAHAGAYYSNERNLVKLARLYLVSNPTLYPTSNQAVKITLADLKASKLIDSLADVKNPSQQCDGYVEVSIISDSLVYKSYIDCGSNYQTMGYDGLELPITTVVGSGGTDYFRGIAKTTNGSIAVGNSDSSNKGLDTLSKGASDAIIVNYDSSGNVLWKKTFGGARNDYFYGIATASDGYVAVGNSGSGDGDLLSQNRGNNDAVIVKYDLNGSVIWSKTFGGTSNDYYRDVVVVTDGYIASGYSDSSNNDLLSMAKGGTDGIVVKYDLSGNVVWKKSFGGSSTDYVYGAIAQTDGVVIVGACRSNNNDLTGLNKGNYDGIIVKYDLSGNVVWKKNFGGTGSDYFTNIELLSDGFIAVGYANSADSDLLGLNKGDYDSIVVKYDLSGNVVWKNNYGGAGIDHFWDTSVTSDGKIIAVGRSNSTDSDLATLNKGDYDATIVKYDSNGGFLWKNNYGGTSADYFESVIAVNDGVVAAGYSNSTGNDLSGLNKGETDATTVKYSTTDTITWKKNFGGGPGAEYFQSVTYFKDSYVAVGYGNSINGDFEGLNKGGNDAIIFRYDLTGQKIWQKNLGGTSSDYFYDVISSNDDVIVVGASASTNGDLAGLSKGGTDAIIVKYDADGNVVWKKTFGGTGTDYFYGMAENNGGYIAVGYSSSVDVDLAGLNKGGTDAIIVKYDADGDVVWKKTFGGAGTDQFKELSFGPNSYTVVGHSNSTDGDLSGLNKGGYDGIIVEYDLNGNVIWKKNYGGAGADYFTDVVKSSSNNYAIGYSPSTDGDLAGLSKGGTDSIIVSYNSSGSLEWQNNYGGTGSDYFYRIESYGGLLYVAGRSNSIDVDLVGLNKGSYDATLVKYDTAGNALLKNNYGGNTDDAFNGLSSVRDGFVMVGYTSSITGDFLDMGSSYIDAMVVGYR